MAIATDQSRTRAAQPFHMHRMTDAITSWAVMHTEALAGGFKEVMIFSRLVVSLQ